MIAGYEKAVTKGARRADPRGRRSAQKVDDAHRDCVESMLITNRAAKEYILRYRDAALETMAKTENPEYKKSLLRIAEACGNICENPPRSFFEAVQLFNAYPRHDHLRKLRTHVPGAGGLHVVPLL